VVKHYQDYLTNTAIQLHTIHTFLDFSRIVRVLGSTSECSLT